MSDCGVCLYSDASDCEGQIDSASIVTLDRPRHCSECGQRFESGSQMEEATWYDEQDEDERPLDENDEPIEPEQKEPLYTCLVCAEIANAFYCEGDGRMYGGGLWDSLYEVFGELNSSCFDRLTTPAAKDALRRRWMKWKGLPV
jgi:hypothetical protein